jgi:hypothetical protein
MRDEFPEQSPTETMRLNCLQGAKRVTLPCIDFTEEEFTFPEVAKNLRPAEFLKTQREKFEAARVRALANCSGTRGKGKGRKHRVRLNTKVVRAKMRLKLVNHKRRGQMREFLEELRARAAEGYSVRQLIKSHIPDVGGEIKVSAAEVTAAVQCYEVDFFCLGGE